MRLSGVRHTALCALGLKSYRKRFQIFVNMTLLAVKFLESFVRYVTLFEDFDATWLNLKNIFCPVANHRSYCQLFHWTLSLNQKVSLHMLIIESKLYFSIY